MAACHLKGEGGPHAIAFSHPARGHGTGRETGCRGGHGQFSKVQSVKTTARTDRKTPASASFSLALAEVGTTLHRPENG